MESGESGVIFDIQRFSIHDGPGIRTTVFLKGCPLGCVWCHNPESKAGEPEIAYYAEKCALCAACVGLCPSRCHEMAGGAHVFRREGCARCGRCAQGCHAGAMALIGREITAGEAIAEVLKDEVFYSHSGGGLTLSGGEPFFQGAFALALLRLAKERNLHACAETCGAVPWETLRRAAEFTDIFLYDVKETSAERHRACTGAANGAILSNLEKLDAHGARIVLRCPIVPGLNDREDHFAALGALAGRLRGVERVDIEPYHPLGLSKAAAIGKPQLYEGRSLTGKDVSAEWARKVERHTDKPVAVS